MTKKEKEKEPLKAQRTYSISVQQYPHCCGIHVIHGFDLVVYSLTKLNDQEKANWKETIKLKRDQSVVVGMALVALNSLQVKQGLGAICEELGFKNITGAFYHPGHGRYITIYAHENHPNKREPGAFNPMAETPEKKRVVKKRSLRTDVTTAKTPSRSSFFKRTRFFS